MEKSNTAYIFQGVETASQIRYVTYYEKLLSMPCTYPDVISLKIESIDISGNNLMLISRVTILQQSNLYILSFYNPSLTSFRVIDGR